MARCAAVREESRLGVLSGPTLESAALAGSCVAAAPPAASEPHAGELAAAERRERGRVRWGWRRRHLALKAAAGLLLRAPPAATEPHARCAALAGRRRGGGRADGRPTQCNSRHVGQILTFVVDAVPLAAVVVIALVAVAGCFSHQRSRLVSTAAAAAHAGALAPLDDGRVRLLTAPAAARPLGVM